MWKEHTTHSPNRGLWIGDCRLSLSLAMGSRYTTKRRETVLKVTVMVQEVWWAWHTWLLDYSGWMWSGWIWSGWMCRMQERRIKRDEYWFRGAAWTVDRFGGAPCTVDSLGRASGKALSWFSLELSTTVVIPPWRSVCTDLSVVTTWAGLGLSVLDRVFVEYVITWLWVRAGSYFIGYMSSVT